MSKFFDSVLDGSADLKVVDEEVKEEKATTRKPKKAPATDAPPRAKEDKEPEPGRKDGEQVVLSPENEETVAPPPAASRLEGEL